MKKYLNILSILLIMMLLFYSCNQDKRNFNKAKDSESTEELKSFIADYPNSVYVDSANALIEKLIWHEALLENSTRAYEAYLSFYPDGQYVDEVHEQIEIKKENLNLALNTFYLAQQTNVKSEQEELYLRTDSLFKLANFTEFILEVYKEPTLNLHLDQENSLSEFIERPFTTSRFLYGGLAGEDFIYNLENEKINGYILYKLILGSADVTQIKITIQLMRNGKMISNIGESSFTVSSNQYSSYIGFLYNDGMDILPNDKLRFVIYASGSDYGKSCDNFASYIKVLQTANDLDTVVLAERERAIEWSASNSKWSHPGAPLIDFIAQLDYCVLNNKNGKWDIGWGSQKDGQPYNVAWKNDYLIIKKLTKEKADALGIKEYTMGFSIE